MSSTPIEGRVSTSTTTRTTHTFWFVISRIYIIKIASRYDSRNRTRVFAKKRMIINMLVKSFGWPSIKRFVRIHIVLFIQSIRHGDGRVYSMTIRIRILLRSVRNCECVRVNFQHYYDVPFIYSCIFTFCFFFFSPPPKLFERIGFSW